MTYDTSNIDNISPAYLASYGLTEAPFSEQHDDRYFYLNSSLNERLALLKHYTQYGNLLLLITGERGIGKSSIKQRFISTAQEEWQICEIQSHTMMDASLLLRQVATGFNITEPPLEPAILFEVLSEQLDHMHQQGIVPILIVDDAHELPQDALQALLYLAEHHSDEHSALRIILFCEPEIETMLEDPAICSLKERVTHSMELPALDETQTAEYLRHRLAVAGLDGTSPFTPKLINKIFKASAGIPSKINEYAHKNLLDDSEPFISDERDLDEALIDNVSFFNKRNMLLTGLAIATVITVLLFQDSINKVFEEPDNIIVKNNAIPSQTEENDVKASSENLLTEKSKIKEKPVETKTIELTLNKEAELTNKPIIKESQPNPLTNTILLTSVNPNPVPSSKQRQIISISGSGFHKRQKVKVSWTNKEKILADTQVNITSDSYMNLILNTGTKADTWTVTVIDTLKNIESNTISFDVISAEKEAPKKQNKIALKEKEQPKKITSQAAQKQPNGLFGQSWIKQQNKNHFTLQLLGTHQENTLPQYLEKYSLNNDAAIFKSKRNDKDWFTLVYGNYPTKAAAADAVKQLPKGVNKPWVRSFASILPSLKQNLSTKTTAVVIPSSNIPDNQESWLWSQDPSHYTLQLTAGTDKNAIKAFIKRHGLRGKAVYFHRLRDGKDWYILVHGSYAGYSKAKQAISHLPSEVRKSKPWARSFSAIHAELN